ncbi:MAG: sigma-54 interaction domain-containing protein [Nitrospinota bacterium]
MEFGGIISNNPKMLKIFEVVQKIAITDLPVLILGESGTGKELIARAIHYNSKRRNKAFFPINCGALPETLLESELFGYKKGAFTGATSDRDGVFKAADRGSLFLDEIGELPFNLQAKLLRVLQDGELKVLGSDENISVDVRLISATNSDIGKKTREKGFREDLYYRLNVASIHLPPLRERIDDIPLLAFHFMKEAIINLNKKFKDIEPEVYEILSRYSWPGNIRELQNIIYNAVAMADSPPTIRRKDLIGLREKISQTPRRTRLKEALDKLTLDDQEDLSADNSPAGKRAYDDLKQLTEMPFYLAREEFEKNYIKRLLESTNGNVSRASRIGKINRKSLRTKAQRYGLIKS